MINSLGFHTDPDPHAELATVHAEITTLTVKVTEDRFHNLEDRRNTHGRLNWLHTHAIRLAQEATVADQHTRRLTDAAEASGNPWLALLGYVAFGPAVLAVGARTARITQLREQIARRALDSIRTPDNARILHVTRIGSVLIVATEQPGQRYPYNVDSFRFPTPDPTDHGHADESLVPKRWTVIDQHGADDLDEVPGMVAKATAYLAELDITAEDAAAV